MVSLNEIRDHGTGTIVWLIGRRGDYLRSALDLSEEMDVEVIQNVDGAVIISAGGRRFALDRETARSVKVKAG